MSRGISREETSVGITALFEHIVGCLMCLPKTKFKVVKV